MSGPDASLHTQRLAANEGQGTVWKHQLASVYALPAGTVLQEYRIEAILGSGGFGITYLAHDVNLDCKVAIKEYFPGSLVTRSKDQAVRPQAAGLMGAVKLGRQQFLDEARTLAMFHHTNIVRVRRFFQANQTAYMVLEYEEGESLLRWVFRRGKPDRSTLLHIVLPLLDGLEAVHQAGFLHRDMKPSNIVVRPEGSPVLLDFGAARSLTTDHGATITAILTPGYAPFEQYHSRGRQGPWSDLYSLGAVMYWMVTGEKPIESPARVKDDPLTPATAAADLGRYGTILLTAIDWALDPDDRRRPQSVAEFRGALSDPDPTVVVASLAHRLAVSDDVVQTLEAQLARHLGPVAKRLVEHAVCSVTSLEELCRTLERGLPTGEPRDAFRREIARMLKGAQAAGPMDTKDTQPIPPPRP